MTAVTLYIKRLNKLQQQTPIKLELFNSNGNLILNGIAFKAIPRAHMLVQDVKVKGILIKELSKEELRYCLENKISYFTLKNQLGLFTDNYIVTIEPHGKGAKIKRKLVSNSQSALATPTLLISPNGFKILDILFRISPEELVKYRSALAFANYHHVNQPRLSKIMRTLKVHSLQELQHAIKQLPENWWRMSLTDKSTHKRLTKFFQISRPHYSLLDLQFKHVQEELRRASALGEGLAQGPLEVAKDFGFLRDEDLSLWGTKEAFYELKKKFKLIPGVEKEKPVWHLATPKYGLDAEAILTSRSVMKWKDSHFGNTNVFRAIWDLGFGTERLKELQIAMIKRAMNEF